MTDPKKLIQNAVPKDKKMEKERSRDVKHIIKGGKLHYLEGETRGNEEEAIFEKIMDENLPELLKYTKAQIQKF